MNIKELELSNLSEIKAYVEYNEAFLNSQFFETSIEELLNQRAALFDELLARLWSFYNLEAPNISLNAVGGYGRSTLHPKSDIDICIIFTEQLTPVQETNLSTFLTHLWDFGVDIGYAVRSEKDNINAARDDITIATNLLDIRTLSGASSHADNILVTLYSSDIWTSRTFFEHKIEEQENRHLKANNTTLYLEPNIKNNPGGMRDFQTIVWIASKHFNVSDVRSLKSLGFLKPDEYSELIESHDFICRIRWALHTVSKRPEERLLFDHQLAVAKFMKFGHGDNGQLAVEKMMRQLFRAMAQVRELNQMMTDIFKREILQADNKNTTVNIDDKFSICNDMIQVNYDEVFYNKANVIKLFRLIAENEQIKSIAPETLRLIRQTRRRLLGEFQDYQECRTEFLAIIKHPNGLKLAFSLMHRYGILASYFPQWKTIEGQMQFDMHNAYTVDEHACKLIHFLNSFNSAQENKVLVNSLYRASSFKHVLVIAGLCHDLSGKQSHEANELSAIHAQEFSSLHQLKKSENELVTWLVKNQDLLISTTQTQDIKDPEIIKKIAKAVGTESKLNALYCFTVADLKATNDQLWNEWQESLLDDLYFSLRKALKQGIEKVFELRTIIRENKAEALTALLSKGFSEATIKSLWVSLPSSFFSSNHVEELIEFSMTILSSDGDKPIVSLSEDSNHGCTNLLVYVKDRSMLFVDLFNTLVSLKIRVKEAQILKTKSEHVLEIIKILDHTGESISDAFRLKRITKRINDMLLSQKSVPKPVKPRFVNNFENDPTVEFLATPKLNKTLLRINALDDPLFIGKICSVFKNEELTIHSAIISTLGECSENVFLISKKHNEPLTDSDKSDLVELLVKNIA
ncbi:MAG: [protein-PII] uridylyltransferase [Gammaproteobacteria bacterium]|nr:[protein-PII] uridylyltransferase [Gammaproteobacteria bacterium]